MNQTIASEVSNHLLFRYRIDCGRFNGPNRSASELPASCRLPVFNELDKNRDKPFAELRAAWNLDGLYFWLKVKGKKQSIWSRNTQLLDSDGLQVWIDTRDTHNIHRASKFCHWIVMLPAGGGNDGNEPIASMLNINRAREHSPSVNQMPISVSSSIQAGGYTLSAFIPAGTINGWNPDEHRMIGFHYVVTDRELGSQSLGVGVEYPIAEDPSLWSTLVLKGGSLPS